MMTKLVVGIMEKYRLRNQQQHPTPPQKAVSWDAIINFGAFLDESCSSDGV